MWGHPPVAFTISEWLVQVLCPLIILCSLLFARIDWHWCFLQARSPGCPSGLPPENDSQLTPVELHAHASCIRSCSCSCLDASTHDVTFLPSCAMSCPYALLVYSFRGWLLLLKPRPSNTHANINLLSPPPTHQNEKGQFNFIYRRGQAGEELGDCGFRIPDQMPLLTLATTEIRSKEPRKSALPPGHVLLLHMEGDSRLESNYEMMNLRPAWTQGCPGHSFRVNNSFWILFAYRWGRDLCPGPRNPILNPTSKAHGSLSELANMI